MSRNLKDMIDEYGLPDPSRGSKGRLTFGELRGLKANEALGIPACTYIELLDGYESKKRSNIVFSLQQSTLQQLNDLLPVENSTDRALFFVKTDQSVNNNRVYVQLNTRILEALSIYKESNPDKHDSLTAMYDALYVGEETYRVSYKSSQGVGSRSEKTVYGLRDIFYVDTKPVIWYPIVKETTAVERPDGNTTTSNTPDIYEPDGTDAKVKKNNTKNVIMLAIAALSLLN